MAQSPEERRAALEARLTKGRAKREAEREARTASGNLRPDDLVFNELRDEWKQWNSGDNPDSLDPDDSKIMGEVGRLCTNLSKEYLAKTYSNNNRADTPFLQCRQVLQRVKIHAIFKEAFFTIMRHFIDMR